jgi:hypothetical protein
MHLKHSKALGLQKYYKLGGRNTLGEITKERNVFDKMVENKELFTKDELKHALRYLNGDVYHKHGIDPIAFDFDIEKIPAVRKEINIKTILSKK